MHDGLTAIDQWFEQRSLHPERQTCVMMPDTRRVFGADPELHARWYDTFVHRADTLRLILSTEDVADPRATETLLPYLEQG